MRPPTAASKTNVESFFVKGVAVTVVAGAVLTVLAVSGVVVVVSLSAVVESLVSLHDHIKAADRQMAKGTNFFFIK